MTLKQAKTLIAMPVRITNGKQFIVTEIRQLKNGKILAYNKFNWCCDVNTLRNTDGKKFNFEKIQELNDK